MTASPPGLISCFDTRALTPNPFAGAGQRDRLTRDDPSATLSVNRQSSTSGGAHRPETSEEEPMTASRTHQTRKAPAVPAMQPPARPGQTRHMAGVTLIELVITLSIAAILMTIAVPSFQDLMRNNRTAAQVNEFLTTLNLARSEAVKRGAQLSVCASDDQEKCTEGTDWAVGWILFVGDDPKADPLEILRVWPAMAGVQSFTADAGTEDASQVTFRGTGQATAAITFTYTPTGCTGDQQRTITVTAVGRASSSKTACP